MSGTIKDSSGAVLPGATVTVRGGRLPADGQSVISSASGEYRVALLPPGTYSVEATASGLLAPGTQVGRGGDRRADARRLRAPPLRTRGVGRRGGGAPGRGHAPLRGLDAHRGDGHRLPAPERPRVRGPREARARGHARHRRRPRRQPRPDLDLRRAHGRPVVPRRRGRQQQPAHGRAVRALHPGLDPGVRGHHHGLRGAVRAGPGRGHEHRDAVRQQRLAGLRVPLRAQRRAGLLQRRPTRTRPSSSATSGAAPSAGPSSATRPSSSAPSRSWTRRAASTSTSRRSRAFVASGAATPGGQRGLRDRARDHRAGTAC